MSLSTVLPGPTPVLGTPDHLLNEWGVFDECDKFWTPVNIYRHSSTEEQVWDSSGRWREPLKLLEASRSATADAARPLHGFHPGALCPVPALCCEFPLRARLACGGCSWAPAGSWGRLSRGALRVRFRCRVAEMTWSASASHQTGSAVRCAARHGTPSAGGTAPSVPGTRPARPGSSSARATPPDLRSAAPR